MVKLVVLYGPPTDSDAFERHYADMHTALATAVPRLRRFEAARGIATRDGSDLLSLARQNRSQIGGRRA